MHWQQGVVVHVDDSRVWHVEEGRSPVEKASLSFLVRICIRKQTRPQTLYFLLSGLFSTFPVFPRSVTQAGTHTYCYWCFLLCYHLFLPSHIPDAKHHLCSRRVWLEHMVRSPPLQMCDQYIDPVTGEWQDGGRTLATLIC